MKFDLHFKLEGFGVLVKPLTSVGRQYVSAPELFSGLGAKALYKGATEQGDHISFENAETRNFLAGQ